LFHVEFIMLGQRAKKSCTSLFDATKIGHAKSQIIKDFKFNAIGKAKCCANNGK
jgi:hypothetical protein